MQKHKEPVRTLTYYKNRFRTLTEKEADLRKYADNTAWWRAQLIVEMHQGGMSYGQIAEALTISRSRVQQLVGRTKPKGAKK